MASRLLLLLLTCLAIGAPLEGGAQDGGPPLQLTRCPSGDLTLAVPRDLPAGSVLFSWDPALMSVQSSRAAYKLAMTKTLSRASPSARARAFFTDQPAPGLEDAWSLAPGASRVVLTRALPDEGADFITGRFHLTCSAAPSQSQPQTRPKSRSPAPLTFRVHLRLLAALADARLHIGLGPLLLLPARPVRVRLLDASDPRRVRLLASTDGAPPSILLSLAPGESSPLAVSLEAADAAGNTDVTTLLVSAGRLLPEPPHPPGPARWRRMGWWLPALISAGVLLALGLLTCALACACAWRRHLRARDAACVKPAFV